MKKSTALTSLVAFVALLCCRPAWGLYVGLPQGTTVSLSIQPLFWVPPPDDPKGPSTGMVGEKLTYTTEGHDPLSVHEFQYSWGDGTTGGWKDNEKQAHTYGQEGTFHIRARERCPLGLFLTDWSGSKTVTIAGNIADASVLSVQSSPVSGISMGGSAPGKTNYIAYFLDDESVTLTAPSSATVKGAEYTFQNWVLGGVPQAAGVTGLSFQITGNVTAEAVYLVVPRDLDVQSGPVTGVAITGSPGGTTNYPAVVADNAKVTLTAPSIVSDSGSFYGFLAWSGLPKMKATSLKQSFRITADTTMIVTYGLIELAVVYPNDPGLILERGAKVSLQWDAVNLPKGYKVKVELVKGGTQTWTLSSGTTKSPFKWTVGKVSKGEVPYPDGDDYTIRVSALDGGVSAESDYPFAIATPQSLTIIGPPVVIAGVESPQYTCIAHYNYGGDADVTTLAKWKCNPTKYAKISKTGLLTTKPVPSGQDCQITATYGKGKPPLTGVLDVSLHPQP
jgi:hypothetical protein